MHLSLPLLLALTVVADAGTATLDADRWRALTAERPPERVDLPAPGAVSRRVVLDAVEGGLLVSASWTVWAPEPAFFQGTLIGSGAHVTDLRWNGRPAVAATTPAGTTLAGWVDGVAEVTLEAFVPAREVTLLPAARGTVTVTDGAALSGDGAPALDGTDGWITGAGLLRLEPPRANADAGDLVLARAGVGLTLGDAELTGRARVAWIVRRGRLDRVALRVAGIGDDLSVDGPNVASWRRSGDRVEVTLREPAADRVDLTLAWTTPTPQGAEVPVEVPRVEPLDAFRTETTLQLAREEGLELTPALRGWEPIASTALPAWGRDLVIGTPAGAWRGAASRSGRVDLLRFTPVSLPPVMIDVADHRVATTAEGRVLARAFYEVRNERAPFLRISPPKGWNILGARVGERTARPTRDGDGGWLIPLPRSVETVEGLLPFTIEVAFLGEVDPFRGDGPRDLEMPVVDATVAQWRATVALPPGHRSLARTGEGGQVEAFTEGEGIAYGFAVGTVGAAQADTLFEEAVTAWLANEFDTAQEKLDALDALGAQGEKIGLLQSNLDLVEGRRDGDDYASQRIRSQAKARAASEEVAQKDLERKAEERKRAGDLSASAEYYQQAIEIGDKLSKIEGAASVESTSRNAAYGSALEEIEEEAAILDEVLGETETVLPWDVEGEVAWDVDSDLDWEVDGAPEWAPAIEEMEDVEVLGALGTIGTGRGGGGGSGYGRGSGTVGRSASGVAIEQESLQNVPMGRSYQITAAEARRSSPGKGRGGRKSKAPAASADDASFWPSVPYEDLPEPQVHASALSVTVPMVGEIVRFEHRLVPASGARPVTLHTRIPASERRTPR